MKKVVYWTLDDDDYNADYAWRKENRMPPGRVTFYSDYSRWIELLLSDEDATAISLRRKEVIISDKSEIFGFQVED